MLKEIVRNEIRTLLGHKPTDAEYRSAMDYLSDTLVPTHTFSDAAALLLDWRHDELVKCDHCEEYFLPEQIEERELPWNHFYTVHVCSDECMNDYCETHAE